MGSKSLSLSEFKGLGVSGLLGVDLEGCDFCFSGSAKVLCGMQGVGGTSCVLTNCL